MSELLESRWQETKEALLEGLSGTKKSVMGVTLENTRKYLSESATAGSTSAGNVATLNRVILPVIRRVMPTVIANELVGVQPMTGPVGQIHTLRVRYSDSVTNTSDSAQTTVAGEEALSPFKIAEQYSGSGAGKAAATAALEGAAGNKMSIQILKQTVEAKTRNCLHVGHSRLHKMHKPNKALTSKQKSWLLWLKKSLLKSTKKF